MLSMPREAPTAIPAIEAVGKDEAVSDGWVDDEVDNDEESPPSGSSITVDGLFVGFGGSPSANEEELVVSGAGRSMPIVPKSSLLQRISNAGADKVVPPNSVVANLGFSSLQSKPLDWSA